MESGLPTESLFGLEGGDARMKMTKPQAVIFD